MRKAGHTTAPIARPHSPDGDKLGSPLSAYTRRIWDELHLMDLAVGVLNYLLGRWEGDTIIAPSPPPRGVGFTTTHFHLVRGVHASHHIVPSERVRIIHDPLHQHGPQWSLCCTISGEGLW